MHISSSVPVLRRDKSARRCPGGPDVRRLGLAPRDFMLLVQQPPPLVLVTACPGNGKAVGVDEPWLAEV